MELRLGTSYRQILFMAMPITLAMLVPQINFITNNIFLGMLGEQQLASAGITGVYYLIFAVIGNGLNNGLQAEFCFRYLVPSFSPVTGIKNTAIADG